jgi:hypothetical protein
MSNFLAGNKPTHKQNSAVFKDSWTNPVEKDNFSSNPGQNQSSGIQKMRVLPASVVPPTFRSTTNYAGHVNSNGSSLRPRGLENAYIDPRTNQYKPKEASSSSNTEEVTLSLSQKKVLDMIMARESVFFTGAAGTGKSYVIKLLREVLDDLGMSDVVSFTAPTGVAACNIRGLTIHAWAGIGLASEPVDQLAAMVRTYRCSMCVCMYACICICIYVFVFVYVFVYMCMCMCMCVYLCICVCVCVVYV